MARPSAVLPLVLLLFLIPLSLFLLAQAINRPKAAQISPATYPSPAATVAVSPTQKQLFSTPTLPVTLPTKAALPQDPQLRLLYKVEHRAPLSAHDLQAKNNILALLSGKSSGTVYTTQDYSIDYVSSGNVFQVEIRSSQVDLAKQEATQWFQSKGMSQEGICNYPVEFYLNKEVSDSLGTKKADFSPLPPGC